jgi:hypothetical protein
MKFDINMVILTATIFWLQTIKWPIADIEVVRISYVDAKVVPPNVRSFTVQ